MITRSILEILVVHFNNSSWPPYLNRDKLSERSSVLEYPKRPGWHLVKIERHQAAFGATYQKGLPMTAYQTYYMRYAVNQTTGEVEELPATYEDVDIEDFDLKGLIDEYLKETNDLSIESTDDGKYQIRDRTTKENITVSTWKEAENFAKKKGIETADDYVFYLGETTEISKDQLEKIAPSCREYIESSIISEIQNLWHKRKKGDV